MSSGIDQLYDLIFDELKKIEVVLTQLRDDNITIDGDKETIIKYVEGKKSELYQLYNSVYKDSSEKIIDALHAIGSDVYRNCQSNVEYCNDYHA